MNRLADSTSPVPVAAQGQSGRLVAVVRRGVRRGAARGRARSCSPSATPPATGATSWPTSPSRTTRPRPCINEHFVAIKVDREERPDVDAVYMEATQALTGHGGWPMTVFADPRRPAVLRRHVLPTRAAARHAVVPQLLACDLARPGGATRRACDGRGHGIAEALASGRRRAAATAAAPTVETLPRRVDELAGDYDPARGGFGGAPKFPPSMVLEFLLRHHARTGDAGALRWSRAPATAMARGGMYDQLAGGFARYSRRRGLGGPALREDAVRQRAAAPGVCALVAGDGRPARERVVRGDRASSCSATAHARGRLRLRTRRRHRRGSRAAPTSGPRSSSSRCSAPRTARGRRRCSASTAAGTFEHGSVGAAAAHRPGRPGPLGRGRAPRCSRRA